MYSLLGISLLFAFFFALNFIATLMAATAWRAISPIIKNRASQFIVQIIFILRILPVILAFVVVFAFFLPAYLLFEPHTTDEIITPKLAIISIISAFGMGIALYRVFGAWWTTKKLISSWVKLSEKIIIENVDIPLYCVRHPFPLIAVVGTFRPRMFVASQIFESLSEDEVKAAIAHEYGHLKTHDNLKRTLLRVCRDLLIFSAGKNLDRAWIENSEAAADEYAAQTGGKSAALNLASALVKIARIVPKGLTPAMPMGAFLIGEETIDITWRVRHLLNLTTKQQVGYNAGFSNISFIVCLSLFFTGVLLLATNHSFLQLVHHALEFIVAHLQ